MCASALASTASARCWWSGTRRASPSASPRASSAATTGSSSISRTAALAVRIFSSAPAASRSRSKASTSSASGTRREPWRWGRLAFNLARDHARERIQFGRPLCEFQGIQWKFAEMALELEAARLLLYRAAANADRGLPSAYETSLAKAYCNQAGFRAANEAVQVLGGPRVHRREHRRIMPAPHPRLDDRRRLDRDPEEPHRRVRLRSPVPAKAAPCRRSRLTRDTSPTRCSRRSRWR